MESKIEATDRLRRENRWDEASRYRDEVREQLRANGVPSSEASKQAWEAMCITFPPIYVPAIEDPEPIEQMFKDFEFKSDSGSTSMVTQVMWTWNNLEKISSDPPCRGAVGLLKWARSNKSEFFKTFVAKVYDLYENQRIRQQKNSNNYQKIFAALEAFEASCKK